MVKEWSRRRFDKLGNRTGVFHRFGSTPTNILGDLMKFTKEKIRAMKNELFERGDVDSNEIARLNKIAEMNGIVL